MKSNYSYSLRIIAIFLLAAIAVVSEKANAQTEIFALAGYLGSSDIIVAEGELNVDDAFSYGVGIDKEIDRHTSLEFSWDMSKSSVSLDRYGGTNIPISDIYIHHFLAGALVEPQSRKRSTRPFGLVQLGATLFQSQDGDYDDLWRFTIALGGGVKFDLSEKLGIRLQGRVIIPMQFSGGGIYVGTGGAGVSVGAWSSFVEGDISGSLFIKL